MRRLRRHEIELRIAICKAFEDDPTLRYVDLEEQFSTSAYTIARALEQDVAYWQAMLGRRGAAMMTADQAQVAVETRGTAEHAVVVVRGVLDDDDKVSYSLLDNETGKWDAVPGTTPVDALAGHFKMGFEIVAAMKTERGVIPLAGAWEIWLKRWLPRKEKSTGGTA